MTLAHSIAPLRLQFGAPELYVVLNWFEELTARVPTP